MPVNLSIKSVPDDLAERLRRRARAHHRSLQGELLAILEEAAGTEAPLSVAEVLDAVRRAGLRTPRESAAILRQVRDAG